jgi:hypothetical protein
MRNTQQLPHPKLRRPKLHTCIDSAEERNAQKLHTNQFCSRELGHGVSLPQCSSEIIVTPPSCAQGRQMSMLRAFPFFASWTTSLRGPRVCLLEKIKSQHLEPLRRGQHASSSSSSLSMCTVSKNWDLIRRGMM